MTYPRVLSERDTIQAALDGRSLARFGDGELKIIRGRDAKSQRYHPDLARILRGMLQTEGTAVLPCIPRLVPSGPKDEFWRPYALPPYTWFYTRNAAYGSSFITRPDSAPHIDDPFYWSLVRQLWMDRDVVLVRGSGKSLTPERLAGARSVKEILGPVQHAWAAHRELFQQLRGEKRRVLLCLGATATALAYMLAEEGVHALDLGHLGMFTKRIGEDGTVGAARRNDKD